MGNKTNYENLFDIAFAHLNGIEERLCGLEQEDRDQNPKIEAEYLREAVTYLRKDVGYVVDYFCDELKLFYEPENKVLNTDSHLEREKK